MFKHTAVLRCLFFIFQYTRETGTLKTRDWKTWDQIAGVEKTGLENTGPKRMRGIHGTGKRRTKFPGWKTHDLRLLNAKWISIKLKGTLYDMYIIL